MAQAPTQWINSSKKDMLQELVRYAPLPRISLYDLEKNTLVYLAFYCCQNDAPVESMKQLMNTFWDVEMPLRTITEIPSSMLEEIDLAVIHKTVVLAFFTGLQTSFRGDHPIASEWLRDIMALNLPLPALQYHEKDLLKMTPQEVLESAFYLFCEEADMLEEVETLFEIRPGNTKALMSLFPLPEKLPTRPMWSGIVTEDVLHVLVARHFAMASVEHGAPLFAIDKLPPQIQSIVHYLRKVRPQINAVWGIEPIDELAVLDVDGREISGALRHLLPDKYPLSPVPALPASSKAQMASKRTEAARAAKRARESTNAIDDAARTVDAAHVIDSLRALESMPKRATLAIHV